MTDFHEGQKVVCICDDWVAFLGNPVKLQSGMRMTVFDRKRVAGLVFLSFEQSPSDYYMAAGFRPEVVN